MFSGICPGNISIAQGEGRVVSLVGMRNTLFGASITKTGSMPTNRMTVNIVGSDITPNIGLLYVNLNLMSCKVSGTTTFSYGRIIGNELLEALEMMSDVVSTDDINFIVGNKISSVNGTAFYTSSSTQYLYFGNNYVRSTTAAANCGSYCCNVEVRSYRKPNQYLFNYLLISWCIIAYGKSVVGKSQWHWATHCGEFDNGCKLRQLDYWR